MEINAIDLFSGCGGLTDGLEQSGINVDYAIEVDEKISKVYAANHPNVKMINSDIRKVADTTFKQMKDINLVSGCPPCQGFTQMNRNNKRTNYKDSRNMLIQEYLRVVKLISPELIMMENVPQIIHFDKFKEMINELKQCGYFLDFKIINVKNFGVPQNRKRLVLLGSKRYQPNFPDFTTKNIKTVRDCIGNLIPPKKSTDVLQKIHSHHTKYIAKIITMIPQNGGNRKDLPERYWLECHKHKNIGFSDVYGRMKWDAPSPTITGGCLSPSKGRFLHPEQNRSISIREASLLQSFPKNYYFNEKYSKTLLAQMIGNAIPPLVAKAQGEYLLKFQENTK